MSKIIISTVEHDFVIYDVDEHKIVFKKEKTNQLDCKHLEGQGKDTFTPHGVTVDEHHIYVVSNDRLAQYNRQYQFESMVDVPLFVNTHDIIKDKDMLYVCNTSVNNIGIYNLKTKENKFLDVSTFKFVDTPQAPTHKGELDINHVNSLFNAGDKIWFCLHNQGKKLSEYGYIVKDTLEVNLVFSAGMCSHDIEIVENTLYTLSTNTGELIEINLITGSLSSYKLNNSNFIRGLLYIEGKLIIGNSVNYKKDSVGNAYIMIMDLKTKIIISTQILDGILGIKDINFFIK